MLIELHPAQTHLRRRHRSLLQRKHDGSNNAMSADSLLVVKESGAHEIDVKFVKMFIIR